MKIPRRENGMMLLDLLFGVIVAMGMLLIIAQVNTALNRGRMAHLQGSRLAAGAAALQVMLNKYGTTIATSGTAPGFANALSPSEAELRNAGFLPSFVSTSMPFGGTMIFTVRVGTNKALTGLACGNQSIVDAAGQPAGNIAGQIMHAANGFGLRTTIGTPGTLNGPGFQNIASPINGAAVVCAWSALPSQ